MPSVKLGPSFFANELRVYRDWGLAWHRENFQNSVDAGANNIRVTTQQISDTITRIVFEDDGIGMDRKTLEDVYFVLGNTTKNDYNTIGGYGKARILCAFSQEQYSLHTHNLLVKGCGAEYNIEDTPEYQEGVKLTVDVITKRNYYDNTDMLYKLKAYLAYSYLPCKVFINGERWTTWTYNRNHRRSLSFAEVYTNNSQEPGVIVRVNGTMMFMRHSTAQTQVIVEINPKMSREVLLANRDGMVDQYQNELDSFITELQIDKQSAFKAKKNKSSVFNGTGTFKTCRRVKNADILKGQVIPTEYRDAAFVPVPIPVVAHGSDTETETTYNDIRTSIFDIIVDDDDVSNPKIRAVIDRYYPSNWDFIGQERWHRGEYKKIRKGVDIFKFIKMWQVSCENILDILVNDMEQTGEVAWGVGFIFSDKTKAEHKTKDGIHYLLINPVDTEGNLQYSITKKNDLVKMIALGVHEITHVICSYHDECFASLMTSLTAKVMAKLPEIMNLMKEAKEGI